MNDDLIERARTFAVAAHGDQRYGSAPYSVHLAAVHNVAVAFGLNRSIRAAAWLHDCLEDTPTPYGALVENFGREVAELVEAVTGRGADRAERVADAHRKIAGNPGSITLKLSDRIANVEASRAPGSERFLELYRSEQPGIEKLATTAPWDSTVGNMMARLRAGLAR